MECTNSVAGEQLPIGFNGGGHLNGDVTRGASVSTKCNIRDVSAWTTAANNGRRGIISAIATPGTEDVNTIGLNSVAIHLPSTANVYAQLFNEHSFIGATGFVKIDLKLIKNNFASIEALERHIDEIVERVALLDVPSGTQYADQNVPGDSANDFHDKVAWKAGIDPKGFVGIYETKNNPDVGYLIVCIRSTPYSAWLYRQYMASNADSQVPRTYAEFIASKEYDDAQRLAVRSVKRVIADVRCAIGGFGHEVPLVDTLAVKTPKSYARSAFQCAISDIIQPLMSMATINHTNGFVRVADDIFAGVSMSHTCRQDVIFFGGIASARSPLYIVPQSVASKYTIGPFHPTNVDIKSVEPYVGEISDYECRPIAIVCGKESRGHF